MNQYITTLLPVLLLSGLVLILSLFLSSRFTKRLLIFLPKLGLVTAPGGRHIHEKAVPRSGGIGFITVFVTVTLVTVGLVHSVPFLRQYLTFDHQSTFALLVSTILIMILGVIDDKFDISSRKKLLGQIFITSICWCVDIKFTSLFGWQLNPYLSYILTVFWLISFVNAINLIDGLDGLAGGVSVISSITLCLIFIFSKQLEFVVILSVLIGSLIGFLRYNFHPAKLFMGDSGSMSLGLILGCLSLISSTKIATFHSIMIPILACGIPFFDVCLAIWRRLTRRWLNKLHGEDNDAAVMSADHDHLHHRILRNKSSYKKAVITIYSIGLLFSMLSLVLLFSRSNKLGVTYLLIFVVLLAVIRSLSYIEVGTSVTLINNGLVKIKKSILLSSLFPIGDMMTLGFSFVITSKILEVVGLDIYTGGMIPWQGSLLIHLFGIMSVLTLSNIYRVNWFYLTNYELLRFIGTFLLATSIPVIFCLFYGVNNEGIFIIHELFFIGSSLISLLIIRVFSGALLSMMTRHNNHQLSHAKGVTNFLVYGDYDDLRNFLLYLQKEHSPNHLVGLLSDDTSITKNSVEGYKVLGDLNDLPELVTKNNVKLLKALGSYEVDQKTLKFAEENNVVIEQWSLQMELLTKTDTLS